MRIRKDIEDEAKQMGKSRVEALIIELLLDLRDLLKPEIINMKQKND